MGFESPELAYQGFFRADSAKDAPAWAAVMNYPHVRVSARTGRTIYATPTEYADRADWTVREATGWVRSEGVETRRLHQTETKVHLLGGWIRYNKSSEPILENRVTYILTKIDSSWGIQARFGVDSYVGQEVSTTKTATEAVLQAYFANLAQKDFGSCATLCRFPYTMVQTGEVVTANTDEELAELLKSTTQDDGATTTIAAVQTGHSGAVVAVTTHNEGKPDDHSIYVVGHANEQWLIGGVSHIAD